MSIISYIESLQDTLEYTNTPVDSLIQKSADSDSTTKQVILNKTSNDRSTDSSTVKIKSDYTIVPGTLAKGNSNSLSSETKEFNSILNASDVRSDSIICKQQDHVTLFSFLDTKKNTYQYVPVPIWQNTKTYSTTEQKLNFIPHTLQHSQLNWTLLVVFFSVILILGVNSYYRKFINQVLTTLVNFQLADRLLREKNIIVRRAFFMMNLNFLLIFSLFIMLLMDLYKVSFTDKYIINFLLILSIVTSILLIRLILFYIVAYIFEWIPAISQQVHSIYLINKNIGLILLPLVFTAIYTSSVVSRIIIFTGMGLILVASVFKLVRGFQIIIRNGILLYYAILYLCTLELLPWVIGSKLFIYLR